MTSFANAEKSYVIEKGGVSIHVIEFAENENSGFELIDGGKRKNFVSDHYSPESHIFVSNAGYFDGNLNPVGYCRIDGKNISDSKAANLSGFLTIAADGRLALHWKKLPEKKYRDILQAGPFIVDPGGKIGIITRSGNEARRTVVGITDDKKILIMTTSEVYLYDLAKILKAEIPTIERALNLDGGPSTGLIYHETRIVNPNPVINFLAKQREVEPDDKQSVEPLMNVNGR